MSETIVAIATGENRGGIGILRISGEQARLIGEKVFRPSKQDQGNFESHKLYYGDVVNWESGEALDNGFFVWMEPPHTYTGEETVELQVHGSPATLEMILDLCLSLGARIADPGEFTKRAFLNGKMDLLQAEAVAEIIEASSEIEARAARRRLAGKLSQAVEALRVLCIEVLAECEADVDFPDETLPLASRPEVREKFVQMEKVADEILSTYDTNQRMTQGFEIAMIGEPNVGKSSLFNALLRDDRAIVTDRPGTTRDVLREELILAGRRVRLLDTAGIREGDEDEAERQGVEKSRRIAKSADLVLWVRDARKWNEEGGDTPEFLALSKEEIFRRVLPVWNKLDLISEKPREEGFWVSAKTGQGLDELWNKIAALVQETVFLPEWGGIKNERQRNLLLDFRAFLASARQEWERGAPAEITSLELRQAYSALSRVLGQDPSIEDVLGEIFSRFCIGK